MEVASYQPRLLAIVLKREEKVRRVTNQLKNKVRNILTALNIGGNESSEHFNPGTNGIST